MLSKVLFRIDLPTPTLSVIGNYLLLPLQRSASPLLTHMSNVIDCSAAACENKVRGTADLLPC